jgi:formylglycine-generating enzyme required for sulfatase activity
MTTCPAGTGSESCCTSPEVPGGTYYRTYSNDGSGTTTGEADPATVSGFRLDKYLVTVGRFRQFVAAWNNGSGYTPPGGSGKHTHLNGGQGLVNVGPGGGYEAGWDPTDWNAEVSPTDAGLNCGTTTWTSTAGAQEDMPINCVNWYVAYAFCIWDDGFLPSEAEWELAAAGGSQQLRFPWGSTDPGTTNQYAIYGRYYTGSATQIAPVGYASLGVARWGQLDIVGNLAEWNLDWTDGIYVNLHYVDPCTDCAETTPTDTPGGPSRVIEGGAFLAPGQTLLPWEGDYYFPSQSDFGTFGFRCARTP